MRSYSSSSMIYERKDIITNLKYKNTTGYDDINKKM